MEYLGSPDPIGRFPDLNWLRKTIVERALTRGDYVLSGGVRSDYYIDKFRLFSDPHVLRRIARFFVPIIAEINPDLIAGTELGGVVIATAVSQMSNIPLLAVRKEPKGYGAFPGEYVEGPYDPGQKVLLIEDVVSSGRELLAAKSAPGGTQPARYLLRGREPRPCTGALSDPVFTSAGTRENRQLADLFGVEVLGRTQEAGRNVVFFAFGAGAAAGRIGVVLVGRRAFDVSVLDTASFDRSIFIV